MDITGGIKTGMEVFTRKEHYNHLRKELSKYEGGFISIRTESDDPYINDDLESSVITGVKANHDSLELRLNKQVIYITPEMLSNVRYTSGQLNFHHDNKHYIIVKNTAGFK